MKSKAAIGGHPLHPLLVAIPIGLAAWTLTADIVYVFTDEDMTWYDIARWSGFAFWVTALVAALPGLVDYLTMAVRSDARAMATAHMVLNVSTVVLFIVAMAVAWDEGAVSGGNLTLVVVLHAVGVGMLTISGWLGGEMVYRRHLAMIPDTIDLERGERERHYEALGALGERRM